MNNKNPMTMREKTMAKLSASMDDKNPCSFDPMEAKLAGMFEEDAINMDDIDEEESD